MGGRARLAFVFAGIVAAAALGAVAPSIVSLPDSIAHAQSTSCAAISYDIAEITSKIRALSPQIDIIERNIRKTMKSEGLLMLFKSVGFDPS